jgi:hypothetical protein
MTMSTLQLSTTTRNGSLRLKDAGRPFPVQNWKVIGGTNNYYFDCAIRFHVPVLVAKDQHCCSSFAQLSHYILAGFSDRSRPCGGATQIGVDVPPDILKVVRRTITVASSC